jgi:RNA polymerase sigma-70 factor, ECF subfamily
MTTALEINPAPLPVECYRKKVQELTNLIVHHSPRYHRIALCHLGNAADAEDALQDALLLALTHVEQFRGESKMSTWLTTIVINSSRMRLRQRSSPVRFILDESAGQRGSSLADMVADTRPGPEDTYRMQKIAETLAHAISRLSPTLRTTFQLREVDGLSIREAAHVMRVPPGTVKARLARARTRLREEMRKSFRSRDAEARSLRTTVKKRAVPHLHGEIHA